MNTILVPIDFSETSKNASRFAIDLTIAIGSKKIVFYHYYEPVLIYRPNGELDETASIEPQRQRSMAQMEKFIEKLGPIPLDIEVKSFQGGHSIHEGIKDVSKSIHPDLIVMGYKPANFFKDTFIGSHSFSLTKKVATPILIVPHNARFKGFENITFLDDLDNAEKIVPIEKIKNFINCKGAHLSVLHLLKPYETPESNDAKVKIGSMFRDISPEFFYLEEEENIDGVINFVSEKKLDVLITVPKKQNFLGSLFNNYSRRLAHHLSIPLLIAHK